MTGSSPKDAETIFQALDAYDRLNQFDEGSPQKIGFQEIYAYANDVTYVPSPAFKTALASDFTLRRDLNHLLKQQTIALMPRAAAASSGDINKREGDGFSLNIKQSKADDDSVYVIIQSDLSEKIPTLLYIIEEANTHRLVLDDFFDSETQILLSKKADAPLLKALHNPGSEVILR